MSMIPKFVLLWLAARVQPAAYAQEGNTISPGSAGPPYDSESETGNRIYMHADQKAKPPGMKELMNNKLKYPKEALENGISGIVKMQMVNKQELASAGKTGENTSTYGYHDSKKINKHSG